MVLLGKDFFILGYCDVVTPFSLNCCKITKKIEYFFFFVLEISPLRSK